MTVNRENILKVAAAIEKAGKSRARQPRLGFKMAFWRDDDVADWAGRKCGTVMCIGGWTERLCGTDPGTDFGIGEKRHAELCAPPGWGSGEKYTPAEAVAVLRHLAETGEVDWPRFRHLRGDQS